MLNDRLLDYRPTGLEGTYRRHVYAHVAHFESSMARKAICVSAY
jgi:hypothetical protein